MFFRYVWQKRTAHLRWMLWCCRIWVWVRAKLWKMGTLWRSCTLDGSCRIMSLDRSCTCHHYVIIPIMLWSVPLDLLSRQVASHCPSIMSIFFKTISDVWLQPEQGQVAATETRSRKSDQSESKHCELNMNSSLTFSCNHIHFRNIFLKTPLFIWITIMVLHSRLVKMIEDSRMTQRWLFI